MPYPPERSIPDPSLFPEIRADSKALSGAKTLTHRTPFTYPASPHAPKGKISLMWGQCPGLPIQGAPLRPWLWELLLPQFCRQAQAARTAPVLTP